MQFAARLTRAPIAHDPDAAREALAGVPDLPPELGELVGGAAGCSPFISDLLRQEGGWLVEALDGPPEAALAAELDRPAEADSIERLARALRVARRRIALLTALADLGGVWDLAQVTGALTALADRATALAVERLVAEAIRRGKLPGADPGEAVTGAGLAVLAMGKMGARELNFSSDIDLICLFDESRFDPTDFDEARAGFVRITRQMAALLSDRTADGYVFRTDLRLRPDPSVTPVCLSMEAAERYYESVGRTWERAAYIKARPCAGDIAAGAGFLRRLRPFVWRKHLDFAAIQDAHDMRLRIRDHKGLHRKLALEGHNMKLGQGGIRDIEFFTQTRQIIAGGRDPELRVRGTVEGLARLAARDWIPDSVAEALSGHYRLHRETEHRLQMIADAQTHLLPANAEGFDRLARFSGEGDTAAFRAALKDRLEAVASLTEGFFRPGGDAAGDDAGAPALSEHAEALVEEWPRYAALRSDRAMASFRRLRPRLLSQLARAADPDRALTRFDAFLRALPAGVQLFALFEANPQLVELVVDVCATAPRLAPYLARNAAVLDAVIGGDFFAPWPGVDGLRRDLADRLAAERDYERCLDAARRWAREWHFRIGVHHLRGLIDGFEAGTQYADLAQAVVASLWPVVVADFSRRHGPPPGRGAVVLGMGSLGAQRLNAGSDLDLILIYDPAGAEGSDGPRPLGSKVYYARLTKALVLALSAQTAEGRLYEVDMRLRPSGRQGPVATSLAAFRDYQMTEAWTWEHLALTRARVIAGAADLGAEVEEIRRAVLEAKAGGEAVLADVAEMRARIRAARPGTGRWEAKDGPGRILDIELLAQTAALKVASPARRVEAQLRAGVAAGWPAKADAEVLLRAYRFCWQLHCAGRLLADRLENPAALGDGGCAVLLRETGLAAPDGRPEAGPEMALDAAAPASTADMPQDKDADKAWAVAEPEVAPRGSELIADRLADLTRPAADVVDRLVGPVPDPKGRAAKESGAEAPKS